MIALFRWILRALQSLFGGKSPRKKLPSGRDKPPSRKEPRAARSKPKQERAPARDERDERVRVEYAPSLDGEADPGEIVWTWVSYEDDPSQGKDRPVLLIGRRDGSLVGVALTSKRHERAAQIELGAGPWDREGRVSYVKLDRLIDVDASRVRREGAVLPKAVFDRVVRALREVHGAVIAGR
ncbi:MAG: type II toxin-antitoxin system PemK/MazF family toxin [Myxococcales bacterium]|nr:type II toxin-antitoxin system PemK/MazF family toxin [Myxococcales bacterium]